MRTFSKAFYFPILFLIFFSTSLTAGVIFSDDFERSSLGADWSTTGSTGINNDTANSPTRSLYTRSGAASVTSKIINTSSYSLLTMEAWIRRGSDTFSEDPDGGEDLVLEYYNNLNNWVQTHSFSGSGTEGEIFNISYTFGADALHANFRIRIRQLDGDSGGYDYWHIDDISISDPIPNITPEAFTIHDTASIGTLIGSVSVFPSATAFTILSGDTDSLFTIDHNGNIDVSNTILDNNSTSSYDLNISASNANGADTEIITINIVDDIPLAGGAVNTRDFANVPILGNDSITINGSILQIGNQLLCRNGDSSNGNNGSDGATCIAPTANTPNNSWYQYRFKADTDASAPYNSMAKLNFQSGDEVVMARLYWSARINTASPTEIDNAKK